MEMGNNFHLKIYSDKDKEDGIDIRRYLPYTFHPAPSTIRVNPSSLNQLKV